MNQMMPIDSYPGDKATVHEILALAHEYDRCARHLYNELNSPKPLQLAPTRLCAIHAIELYLNALARALGERPRDVRARLHNLGDPVHVAVLRLRKATANHLHELCERREYLIARYAPEATDVHMPMNALFATLTEVADKVVKFVDAAMVKP